MAILSNGWYKGSIPFYEITEIAIAATGSGAESWDGSTAQDGSIMCYRIGTKVSIVCDSVTTVEEKAFFKFLALKKISGLGAVTTIGATAFFYTPNLASIDLVPENLTSIGASAFRMSGAEDFLDLSAVPLSIVGDMATRHKRWGAEGLAAVQGVSFARNIYMEVPNMDSQLAYPDVQYGIKNGEPCYVSRSGCSALTCYHIWNAMFAGTEKQFDNWLDWYNSVVNVDGTYADSNVFDGNVTPRLVSKIGWTVDEQTFVDSSAQLQLILDNLRKRYPTYISINSSLENTMHAITVVGCDAKTHKLAIVDSSVLEDRGVVSWIAFEDIFVGGTSEHDRVWIFSFNFPVLAPNSTWFTQGGTSVSKTSITQIDIKDTYAPLDTVTSSWDASAAKDGSIMAYVEGTKLTIAGNGSGKISLNPDSLHAFSDASSDSKFINLTIINGGNILDTSKVTTMKSMFHSCRSLESIDVSNWATCNVTTMYTMFNNCSSIRNLSVGNWDTGNVTDFTGFLNMQGSAGIFNNSLVSLDVSNWDVSKANTFQNMFNACIALANIDVSRWDTGACANFSSMFANCPSLETLDVSNWDTSNVTSMKFMFSNSFDQFNVEGRLRDIDVSTWDVSRVTNMSSMFQCQRYVEKIDVSNWNTSECTDFGYMFYGCRSLTELNAARLDTTKATAIKNIFYDCPNIQKITLGEKFSFNGNGSLTGSNVAQMPTLNSANIPGADGNWYDVNGNAIAPSSVSDKTFGVYYATPAIAEEDMNQMVLVKKGNLMKTAAAIRTKNGSIKGYAPAEFADAILSNE